jgi:putative nucleotidyltransferase with HDIG domain
LKLTESLAEMGGAVLHRLHLQDERVQHVDRLEALRRDLDLAYDATIEGWSRALDLRDNDGQGHAQRVAAMAVHLARTMGIGDADLVHVRRGALLHDIGKICVPDRILLKPGPLTEEEWFVMRQHPTAAYEMLSPVSHLSEALDIPYCHHERWDGSGYPRGLKGTEIPPAARVFAVVDVWDALRSNRPYRPAWPADRALEHIQSLAGTHFDPDVVRAFIECRVFETPLSD